MRYAQIVAGARRRNAVQAEQLGALPVATLGRNYDMGQIRIISMQQGDYSVVWNPPELHVGQDLFVDESMADLPAVDLSLMQADEALRYVFGRLDGMYKRAV